MQLLFYLITGLSNSLIAFKVLLLSFFVGCMAVLVKIIEIRKINYSNLILFAWNPLILIETASSGHFDIIGAFFILAGLYFVSINRRYLSIISITLAGLIKFFPFILLPLFWKPNNGRFKSLFIGIGISLVVVITFYFHYFEPGSFSFGSLGTFSDKWSFNSILYTFFISIFDSRISYIIIYLILLSVLLFILVFKNVHIFQSCLILLIVFVFLSPVVYPWYLIWLIILFPIVTGSLPLSLFSLLIQLSYLILPLYLKEGIWVEEPWILYVEYGLFAIVLLLYYKQFIIGKLLLVKNKIV